jgi:hypothetical protein
MMDNTLDVLLRQYRDKRSQLADAVSSASAKDYAEYRAICGEIRGLLTAESYLLDLAKNLENSDE